MIFPYRVHNLLNLLRCAFFIGVYRPQVQFLHIAVTDKVGKGAFAGYKPALLFGNFGKLVRQKAVDFFNAFAVGCRVCVKGFGIGRIQSDKGFSDIFDIDEGVFRRHPRVRIGHTVVRAFADTQRLYALAQRCARHVFNASHKFFEPALKTEAVAQNQIRRLRLYDVERRRFVFVNFRTGLCNRFDENLIARNILRHIL